ncbi:hypothetical protein [Hahella chejuensis]|uniref:hypothetical protein n=1 Tax=Hahella chejuensis TaxID=158327 RepID=UPI0005A119D7|nr:hypothetical protein [Hahella chejuensis]
MKAEGFMGIIGIKPIFDIYETCNILKKIFDFIEFTEMDRDDTISFIARNDEFYIALYGATKEASEGTYSFCYNSYSSRLIPGEILENVSIEELSIHKISNRYDISSHLAKYLSEHSTLIAFS